MADRRSHALTAAIRRFGTGRVDFGLVERPLRLLEWVAVTGPAGEEPACVVVVPGDVLLEDEVPAPLDVRPLTPAEQARLPELAALACRLAASVAAALREVGPAVDFLGLRLTFDGAAVVECRVPPGQPLDGLATALGQRLDRRIVLDPRQGPPPRALAGGTGRFWGGTPDAADVARQRFGLALDRPLPCAPGGYPRLGTWVTTPEGEGRVCSVSTRHRTVTLQREDGGRVEVPVDRLTGFF